jgi:hypothetical protein
VDGAEPWHTNHSAAGTTLLDALACFVPTSNPLGLIALIAT